MNHEYSTQNVSALFKFDPVADVPNSEAVFSTAPVTLPTTITHTPEISASVGSAYDGGNRLDREIMSWAPAIQSADAEISGSKELMDARGRDLVRNDPMIANAVDLYRNGVVGNKYILDCRLDGEDLGFDEETSDLVSAEIERKFEFYAHSMRCHVDAAMTKTLTDILRMGVGGYVMTGEVLATIEFIKDRRFTTAINMIDPDRLSNPDYKMDTQFMKGGIEIDKFDMPIAYHIRTQHPGDHYITSGTAKWTRVPARKPWGRQMVIHIKETLRPGQTRGIAKMVAALRSIKMTNKYQDLSLQNKVNNAMVAMTMETDMNPIEAAKLLGSDDDQVVGANAGIMRKFNDEYLREALSFAKSGNVAKVNGSIVPFLPPGTKLNSNNLSDGSIGSEFEDSLIRRIAAGVGLSYEELSKNLSKTSFAGVKAALGQTFAHMQAVKATVADKFATAIYRAWLEEAISRGMIKSLPDFAKRPGWIYEGDNLDMMSKCSWIGAARGTIDTLAEAKTSEKLMELGLTSKQTESAHRGIDYRENMKQLKREAKMQEKLFGPPVAAEAPTPEKKAAGLEARVMEMEEAAEDAKNDV